MFLLTDDEPELLAGGTGLTLERSVGANDLLLDDLRSDVGMGWVPEDMWLTYLTVDAPAAELDYDLAVSATPASRPRWSTPGWTSPRPSRCTRPRPRRCGALGSRRRLAAAGRARAVGLHPDQPAGGHRPAAVTGRLAEQAAGAGRPPPHRRPGGALAGAAALAAGACGCAAGVAGYGAGGDPGGRARAAPAGTRGT